MIQNIPFNRWPEVRPKHRANILRLTSSGATGLCRFEIEFCEVELYWEDDLGNSVSFHPKGENLSDQGYALRTGLCGSGLMEICDEEMPFLWIDTKDLAKAYKKAGL
jgi:hypothetical protein